jgi:hypothetical protein
MASVSGIDTLAPARFHWQRDCYSETFISADRGK